MYVLSTFQTKLVAPFFMEDLKGSSRWFLQNAGVHLPNYTAIIPEDTIHEYTKSENLKSLVKFSVKVGSFYVSFLNYF